MTNDGATDDGNSGRKSQTIARIALCVLIIASGLALRGFGFHLGLPAPVVKYGGSILWGMMVFFLVAIIAPGQPLRQVALVSAAIAVCVELFRLVHYPWLDDFRTTLAGALLLGRIFSPWNMLAYGAGIISGMQLDRFSMRSVAAMLPYWLGPKSCRTSASTPHAPARSEDRPPWPQNRP